MSFSKSLIVVITAYCLSAFVLTACNTTEGFGRDVESTGDAIEDAAD